MGVRPATPGTIVVLAGTVLLLLVSISVPMLDSIYFLKADIHVSVAGHSGDGSIKLGTFGYCINGNCTNSKLGYKLDANELLNMNGEVGHLLGGISSSLIHGLTYCLVIHPIACAFAGLATLCGLLSHIREFSITGFSTCFAVFGAVLSLLAFIFDIILFSIAKSRINHSAKTDNSTGSATLGNAIWMTLAAFLLLMTSGCFFGCGKCMIRNRGNRQPDADKWKPAQDPSYGASMRQDALEAEKWRDPSASHSVGASEGGLPKFAEPEHVPLNQFHDDSAYRDEEERVSGVGYAGPRRDNYNQASYAGSEHPSRQQSEAVPPNASTFTSMYHNQDPSYQQPGYPQQQPSYDQQHSAYDYPQPRYDAPQYDAPPYQTPSTYAADHKVSGGLTGGQPPGGSLLNPYDNHYGSQQYQ